jgi:hypothetical protein
VMLHSFFQRLPSLAGVLLVVFMQQEEVRLGVVVVCHGLGEVIVRPLLALSVAFGGVSERQRRAIQLMISEIASGRTPAAICCNAVVSQPQLACARYCTCSTSGLLNSSHLGQLPGPPHLCCPVLAEH